MRIGSSSNLKTGNWKLGIEMGQSTCWRLRLRLLYAMGLLIGGTWRNQRLHFIDDFFYYYYCCFSCWCFCCCCISINIEIVYFYSHFVKINQVQLKQRTADTRVWNFFLSSFVNFAKHWSSKYICMYMYIIYSMYTMYILIYDCILPWFMRLSGEGEQVLFYLLFEIFLHTTFLL